MGRVAAENLTWAGLPGTKDQVVWENVENWLVDGGPAAGLPEEGDTLTISAGNGSLGTAMSVETLNFSGGNTAIGHYGVLDVSTLNISGGKFQLSNGGPPPEFTNGPPGILNIADLLNITAGNLSGQGEVNVGTGGRITQSGGIVNGAKITTPSYEQTGGEMGARVTTSTYALSGALVDDAASSLMRGTVTVDSLFTLSGDGALVTGSIVGDGDTTMVQSDGRMDGSVLGTATYTQLSGHMGGTVETDTYHVQGGSLAGLVYFTERFVLSGDASVEWMDLVGGRDAVMTQSGGVMAGYVFHEYFESGGTIGIATYSQSGGNVSGVVVADTYELSGGTVTGSVEFAELFALSGDGDAVFNSELRGDGDAAVTQSGGSMDSHVSGIVSYTQSGGTMKSAITVDRYTQSGGTIAGSVSANTYELAGGTGDGFDRVTIGTTLLQSGGVFDRDGVVVPNFTQSGGLFSGSISAQTYTLTDAAATSTGGAIAASVAFNLTPGSGTAIVDAQLSGAGGIVKSGASTVVLTNAGNSFTGGVTIAEGTLEIVNDALTDGASVTIDPDATLKLTTTTDTVYAGTMTGMQGDLVKAGSAAATIAGNVSLGDLWLDAGRLNIGTGTTTNEATFDTATVAAGSTLYIAANATLTIRVPKRLVNNGTLINDGTVHDDLENTGTFANNLNYNANVASNSGTINNNTPGVWTGSISSNAGLISNNAGSTWKGDVITNNGTIQNSGSWEGHVLSNVGYIRNYGTWTGRIDTNTYKDIYNRGADAVWYGDVINNTQIVNIDGAHWNGKVMGNNNAVFNMVDSFWTGAVVANGGGENGLAQINNYGTWLGAVETNAGMIFNVDGIWTGNILSNTDFIVNNHNDDNTNVLGVNQAVWDGDIATNTGLILNDYAGIWLGDVQTNTGTIINRAGASWTGNVLANTRTIATSGTWTGNITSSGRLQASGTVTGAIDTSGGTLELTGNLTAGSVIFDDDSFFDVGVDGAGISERLTVSGTAALAGTLRISAGDVQDSTAFATPYSILRAATVTGEFETVTTDLAFLAPNIALTVDNDELILTLARNNVVFASTGVTANQQSVAAAVTSLGIGNPIYDAFIWLTAAQAQDALNQLSGESQTLAATAAIQGANIMGNLATSRINQSFDALGDTGEAASSFIGDGPMDASAIGDNGLWGQVYGTRGFVDAASGTQASDSYSGGLAAGLDGMLADWRLGMLLQIGTTGTNVGALQSSITSTDYGLGVYGGTQWGATQLSLGGIVTLHDTRGVREVNFPGFTDTLTSAYLSGTAQAFAELSHEFDFGTFSVTPFGSVAQVFHGTPGHTEMGGAAALTSTASLIDATFATLGVGIERQTVVGGDMLLTASASLGWRHAFAGQNSTTHAFSTGSSFSVIGAPIVSDVVVLKAGLALDINATSNLAMSYDGQFGGGTQSHAISASWANGF